MLLYYGPFEPCWSCFAQAIANPQFQCKIRDVSEYASRQVKTRVCCLLYAPVAPLLKPAAEARWKPRSSYVQAYQVWW